MVCYLFISNLVVSKSVIFDSLSISDMRNISKSFHSLSFTDSMFYGTNNDNIEG